MRSAPPRSHGALQNMPPGQFTRQAAPPAGSGITEDGKKRADGAPETDPELQSTFDLDLACLSLRETPSGRWAAMQPR